MKFIKEMLKPGIKINSVFDTALLLIDKELESGIFSRSDMDSDSFLIGTASVEIKKFCDGGFDEITISLGYEFGKGIAIYINNYSSHVVVVNHEVQGTFYTFAMDIATDDFAYRHYRKKFDDAGLRIIKFIEANS
jgi:hypothetical protein